MSSTATLCVFVRWQYNPPPTTKDHQGKCVCVGFQGAFSIQHSAFSAGGIHHHSASSIQHSAQEAFIILQHSAFSAGGLHHSAQEASSFSDEDRVRWQYNPRTTAKDHQGNVCVGNTTQEGFIIIQHSAQEAFSAGPGVLGTHTEQLYQRVARDVRDVHAVVLDSTARPRLLDLQLRQPSLRVMRPWPCDI